MRTQPVSIILMGGCNVVVDRQVVPGVPSSVFRLAAFILLSGSHRSVSRQRLASMLWPDIDLAKASANLRQALARIRHFQHLHDFKFIGSNFSTVYIVQDGSARCDLIELLECLDDHENHSWSELCSTYAGDLLADLGESGDDYEEWLSFHREALRGRFIAQLTDALSSSAHLTAADRATCANKLLQIDPCNEDAYRELMMQAAEHGQLARLHNLYDSCQRHLFADLGVAPSVETQSLFDRLSRSLKV